MKRRIGVEPILHILHQREGISLMASEQELLTLTEWNENWTATVIKVVIISIVFLITVILLFAFGNIKEITENWSRYRCNPVFMPFASNFGYDTADNFRFCVNNIFQSKAIEIFTPIYGLLGNFMNIVKLIVDVAVGLRQLFANFLFGMNRIMRNVRDRIQTLLFQIRLTFMKMQNLMNRVYASMYSMIWIGASGITAGFNLSENDLVKFLFEFCFHPDTRILMNNGSIKQIKDIQIGDYLANNVRVTSTFVFNGEQTPMVQIHDDILSANHLVKYNGQWMPAENHPHAIHHPSIPRLICLNVDGHEFMTAAGLQVADYDESESEVVIHETKRIAESALNGGKEEKPRLVYSSSDRNYDLGLDPTAEIELEDGSWIPLVNIQCGDRLKGHDEVVGIVDEFCLTVCKIHGISVSTPQLIFHPEKEKWIRAFYYSESTTVLDEPAILRQILTRNSSPLHIRGKDGIDVWVRDYREVSLSDMEEPYLREKLTQ